MSRSELEEQIRLISESLENNSDSMTEEEISEAKSRIETFKNELARLNFLNSSFEMFIKNIATLNPGVEIKLENNSDSRQIYCSVSGKDLKLPDGYIYDEKVGVTSKNHSSDGDYFKAPLKDINDAPVDAIDYTEGSKKNAKDNSSKKKKNDKDKKEKRQKAALKRQESLKQFGEVVSCLFGQVDKRFTNFIYKNDRIYEYAQKNADERNNKLGFHIFRWYRLPLALGLMLVPQLFGTYRILSGVLGIMKALGVVGTIYGGVISIKTIGDLVRKINKSPLEVVRNKTISEGSYLENLKKSWKKFRNRKTNKKGKSNNSLLNQPTEEVPVNAEGNINDKVNELTRIVNSELDINNLDIRKFDYIKKLYEKISEAGALEALSPEVREKYEEYAKKVDECKPLLKDFIGTVNALDMTDVKKEAYDKCKQAYDILQSKFGDNIFANISEDIIKKYHEYENNLKLKPTEKKETIDKFKLSKLINEIKYFDLQPTFDSVKKCEELINRVFTLNKEERKIVHSNEELWNKIKNLMKKSKIYCNGVIKFINLVNDNFYFGADSDIKYEQSQLVTCMAIYNRLTDEEKKEIPARVINTYNDALLFDSVYTLKLKLTALDVAKSIKENKYDEIMECCKIYDRFMSKSRKGLTPAIGNDMAHRRKIGKEEILNLPENLNNKLKAALKVREELTKYADADIVVDSKIMNIDGKTSTASIVKIMNGDNVLITKIIPWNSSSLDYDAIREEIIETYPFVDANRITFNTEISDMSESLGRKNRK